MRTKSYLEMFTALQHGFLAVLWGKYSLSSWIQAIQNSLQQPGKRFDTWELDWTLQQRF